MYAYTYIYIYIYIYIYVQIYMHPSTYMPMISECMYVQLLKQFSFDFGLWILYINLKSHVSFDFSITLTPRGGNFSWELR